MRGTLNWTGATLKWLLNLLATGRRLSWSQMHRQSHPTGRKLRPDQINFLFLISSLISHYPWKQGGKTLFFMPYSIGHKLIACLFWCVCFWAPLIHEFGHELLVWPKKRNTIAGRNPAKCTEQEHSYVTQWFMHAQWVVVKEPVW